MKQTKYSQRIQELEADGLCTSDAQGVADIEFAKNHAITMLQTLEWLRANIKKNTLGTVKTEHGVGTVIDAHLFLMKLNHAIAKATGEEEL